MSRELAKKELLLKQTLHKVAQLEEQIAQLRIQEKEPEPPTLPDRFPVGCKVKLTGRNEKYRLQGKKAKVTRHSACFVKLEREGEEFRRAPENITRIDRT